MASADRLTNPRCPRIFPLVTETPTTKEVSPDAVDQPTTHTDANGLSATPPHERTEVQNAHTVTRMSSGEPTHPTLRVAVGHAQNPEDALQRLAAAARAQGKPVRVRVRIDIYDPAKRQYLSWAGAHWGVETDQEAAIQGLRDALDSVFQKLVENPDPQAIVRRMRLPMEEILETLRSVAWDDVSQETNARDAQGLLDKINAL